MCAGVTVGRKTVAWVTPTLRWGKLGWILLLQFAHQPPSCVVHHPLAMVAHFDRWNLFADCGQRCVMKPLGKWLTPCLADFNSLDNCKRVLGLQPSPLHELKHQSSGFFVGKDFGPLSRHVGLRPLNISSTPGSVFRYWAGLFGRRPVVSMSHSCRVEPQ